MATYYISQSGTGNGSSLSTPDSIADFNAGGAPFDNLQDDTVYFLDTITTPIVVPNSGASGHIVTLRGDYPDRECTLDGYVTLSSWSEIDEFGEYTKAHGGLTVRTVLEDGAKIAHGTVESLTAGSWDHDGVNVYYKPTTGVASDHVVQAGGFNSSAVAAIYLEDVSYIRITGFTAKGDPGNGLIYGRHATYIEVDHCYLYLGGFDGIRFKKNAGGDASGHLDIHHNTIKWCNGHGIGLMEACDTAEVYENTVYQIGYVPYETSSDMEGIASNSSGSLNIHDNTVFMCGAENNLDATYGVGIIVYDPLDGTANYISRNRVFANKTMGIAYQIPAGGSTGTMQIDYNIVYQNGTNTTVATDGHYAGIDVDCFLGSAGAVTIYNNTLYKNRSSQAASLSRASQIVVVLGAGFSLNITVKNNILVDFEETYDDPTYYGGEVMVYIGAAASLTADFNYNVYYRTRANGWLIRWDGTNYDVEDWAAFKAAKSQEANGQVSIDPMFINADEGNFHLQNTSPIIDDGVDVSLTYDCDGNVITDLTKDIGALERVSKHRLRFD